MDTASEASRGACGAPVRNGLTADAVRAELDRVLASSLFQNADRLRRFLTSTVDYALEGRGGELKEYLVATEILGRPSSFDPRIDSVVRVEARRVRTKLEEYYAGEGSQDAVIIDLPKGGYTPEFRLRKAVEQELKPPARRRRVGFAAGGLIFSVAAIALWQAGNYRAPVGSLAVLPFLALSDDPRMAYFADGLVDQTTSTLAQVPGLRVAARTAAFRFSGKGHDLGEIGRELNVDAIVEGSVRTEGAQVRITAQLIDVRTGYHLWSATYDRSSRQTLGIPSEIAAGVVSAIRGKRTAIPKRREPVRLEARDLYWKGLYFYKKATPGDYKRSVEALEAAAQIEPDYAPTHGVLAAAYTMLGFHQWGPREEMIAKAKAAAARAVALDDTLGLAHGAQGVISFAFDFDWTAAEAAFRRAIQVEPDVADVRVWFALGLTTRERFDEALAQMRKAVELDPVTYVANHSLGIMYYSARRYEQMCMAARSALDANPNHYGSRALLGTCLLASGKAEPAITEFQQALTLAEPRAFILGRLGYTYAVLGRRREALEVLGQLEHPSTTLVGYQRVYAAQIYAGLGDRDRAFAALEESFNRGDVDALFTFHEFIWDPFRNDARFKALKVKAGLP